MQVTDLSEVCTLDGRTFEITGQVTLLAGAFIKFLGRISDTRTSMNNYFVRVDNGPVSVHIIEAPTVTATGTPITPINRNRNSPNTPDTSIFLTPTVSGGLEIYSSFVHEVGGGAHIQGGDAEMKGLLVFKDNTDYTFEIDNDGATTIKVSYGILWCEEE